MKRFYHQQVANRQTRGCREIGGQGRREWVEAAWRQEGAGCSPFPTAPEEFWAGDPVPPSLLHTPLGCNHAKCHFLLRQQKSKTPRMVGTGACGPVWEVPVWRVRNCQAPGAFRGPAGPRLSRLLCSHIPVPLVLRALLPFPSTAPPLPGQQQG